MLRGKFLVRCAGIRGNSEHYYLLFLDLIPSITKTTRFSRTAWRIVSGIEVHDDMFRPGPSVIHYAFDAPADEVPFINLSRRGGILTK